MVGVVVMVRIVVRVMSFFVVYVPFTLVMLPSVRMMGAFVVRMVM